MAMEEGRTVSGKVWGVIVLVGLLIVMVQHAKAQGGGGLYACWGGCYNECILQNGKNPSERLPCYWKCLSSCISYPASDTSYKYYCQLGCSLEQCIRYSSDGGKMEGCLENCSNKVCRINNV